MHYFYPDSVSFGYPAPKKENTANAVFSFLYTFSVPSHTFMGGICMSKSQKRILHVCLFFIGGLGYNLIELLWRGRTHPSMFLIGGLCFELMGAIHTRSRRTLPVRCGLCALGITAVEFISGCILNRWFQWGVWDYSRMKYNLLGQICLLYSLFWLVLSALACPVYRWCRLGLCRLLFARRGAKLP